MRTIYYSKIKIVIAFIFTFFIVFIFLFLSMNRNISVYDEGIILTAAMRVSMGDIPHRDFYTNYGPAEYYLLSFLFKVFGQNVLIERLLDLIVRTGIVIVVYASISYYYRQAIAIFTSIICTLWLGSIGNHGYPVYPTLLLTIISSILLVRILSRENSVWYPLAAGSLTGLAALFRYDIGFFAFIGHLFCFALIAFLSKNNQKDFNNLVFYKLPIYIFASGLPVVLTLVWYWSNGTFNSFIHDVITFPSQYYARTRSLPFPNILSWSSGAVYLPIMVICSVLFYFNKECSIQNEVKNNSHKEFDHSDSSIFLLVFTTLTAMFYLKGLVRVSPEHMQLALIPAIITLAVLLELSKSYRIWFRVTTVSLAMFTFASGLSYAYKKVHNNPVVMHDMLGFYYSLMLNTDLSVLSSINQDGSPKIKNTSLPFFVDRDRYAAIHFIIRNTAADERIFVGLTRHDKVFVNDVSSYFLANRLPATKWHHFDPGIQNSAEVQSEMVGEFELRKPRFIWLESTWNNKNEPNESAKSSGIFILDEYIQRNYQQDKIFGQISILQRK